MARRTYTLALEVVTNDPHLARLYQRTLMGVGGAVAAPTGVKVVRTVSDGVVPSVLMERVRGEWDSEE
jgi:hypothetical protein